MLTEAETPPTSSKPGNFNGKTTGKALLNLYEYWLKP
jgi:hypothetical protein